jgi:microcompartment protein CcmK/EutM
LVTQGSVAASYFQRDAVPVDALIIGSIDDKK